MLDRTSTVPLQRQLESALREAILSGSLKPGERILSSRELQRHLGVSRNTVVAALGQLQLEGILVTVGKSGTFVAESLQNWASHLERSQEVPDSDAVPTPQAARFLAYADLTGDAHIGRPLRPGIPALDLFPTSVFRRALIALDWSLQTLDYPPAAGDERLRQAIASRLQQTRCIGCSAADVLVTAGAQSAFELASRVLLETGDGVIVEDPGYPSARAAFQSAGARILACPVDENGVDVDTMRSMPARLAYTTPSHQYPTGATLSLDRRIALLEWAERNGAWIVEDDYDCDFNYASRTQPALYGLGGTRRVLYVGTFSKCLSPALRVGFVVLPRALRRAFLAAQQTSRNQPSTIVQRAIAALMESGALGRHITKMRKTYNARRRALGEELLRLGHLGARLIDSQAGLHFVVRLPEEIDDAVVSQIALEHGIVVPPLSGYSVGKRPCNGLVIGFAATAQPAARQAVSTLSAILHSAVRAG